MLFNRLNLKCQVKTHSRYKEFVYGSKPPENDTQDDETDTDAYQYQISSATVQ